MVAGPKTYFEQLGFILGPELVLPLREEGQLSDLLDICTNQRATKDCQPLSLQKKAISVKGYCCCLQSSELIISRTIEQTITDRYQPLSIRQLNFSSRPTQSRGRGSDGLPEGLSTANLNFLCLP